MKGIYLRYIENNLIPYSGVESKINSQINVFNRFGLNCEKYEIKYNTNVFLKLIKRLPFTNVSPTYKYLNTFKDIDYIYMRAPLFTYSFRKLLQRIKRYNSKIKIVVELPTFPYDNEIIDLKFGNLLLFYDKYNRTKMSGLIDRFSTLTNDEFIFGIPTLKFDNGIDFNEYRMKKCNVFSNKIINICAIANFAMWHGYERVIKGIYNYYNNDSNNHRDIVIHMVGNGTELSKYIDLVNKLNINNHFKFYGYMDKNNIMEIYDLCMLSLGTFCAYKLGIDDVCNLKSTESLAVGIPFVNGCKCSRFTNKGYKYFLEFPNDDSDIDFNNIINFYDSIYNNKDQLNVINDIRSFGEKYFSMDVAMKNVVDYLKYA